MNTSEFDKKLKELNDLIIMRQTPNEAYSSAQMEDMIKNKIRIIAEVKYKDWYDDYIEGRMKNSYQSGMMEMYNLMVKHIITDEP